MKIFHLSDLHIGKTVKNQSMIPEQEYIFRAVLDSIAVEKPDCLVVAGDVYDRTAPGVEAVNLFDAFLTELAEINLPVLITGGNHDSPERLNFGSRIMSRNNIHICSAFDGILRKIILSDELGEVDFYLLPYIRPSAVRKFFPDREVENHNDAVRAVIESADIDYSRRCVIVAHQFFINKDLSPERTESENIVTGGLDAVETDIIKGFDYAALGHIHRRQNIGGGHIYYSGSPLKYSASEANDKKGIISVTLNEKGKAEIDILPLRPANDLRRITGKISDLIAAAEERIRAMGNEEGRNDYIFAVLTDEGEIIDAMDKMRAVYPNMMEISYDNRRYHAIFDLSGSFEADEEIENLSPEEMFAEFFTYQNGCEPSENQKKIIAQILRGQDI